MRKVLLLLLVVASVSFADTKNVNVDTFYLDALQEFITKNISINKQMTPIPLQPNYCKISKVPLPVIKNILDSQADTLNPIVVDTLLTIIKCTRKHNIPYNNILTIIDYSLPSDKKRLWIFDLKKNKLLFHTYVSHGINTGTLSSNFFSNKINGKTSSIGIFTTGDSYRGRHGLSLKLLGLDKNFNDKAYQRSIVMHGAWYVDNEFIVKYGRAGRSWGCPAVPEHLTKPIIDIIKGQSLFVVYYPGDRWFLNSKFLNCDNISPANISRNLKVMPDTAEDELRGEIVFVDRNNDRVRQESEPVVAMTTANYRQIFNIEPTLKRLLRRQIDNMEYIVLNNAELKMLDSNKDNVVNDLDTTGLKDIVFAIPEVVNERGYYITRFKFLNLGQIQELKLNAQQNPNCALYFSNKSSVNLGSSTEFIRWLGL